MKRYVLVLMIVVFYMPSMLALTSKVVEKSTKSTPDWLYEQPDDALVVEVEAPDMSTAKDKAVDELLRRVIMSVATNVIFTSSSSARHEEADGKLKESEYFGYDSKIASAQLPFVKGISLTEAKDVYWEKCREKKSDRIFYRYAILYPMPKSQIEKMRQEFEAIDSEKARSLEQLKSSINSVTSADEIEQSVSKLKTLTEYFFDDVRRNEAEGLLANYKQLYKGMTLKASEPSDGHVKVILLLQGRPFQVAGVPTLKANCATKLTATPLPDGSGYDISYDDIDCLDDEDNWIEINLRMRDARITQKVFI